jgi:hypothetical protein
MPDLTDLTMSGQAVADEEPSECRDDLKRKADVSRQEAWTTSKRPKDSAIDAQKRAQENAEKATQARAQEIAHRAAIEIVAKKAADADDKIVAKRAWVAAQSKLLSKGAEEIRQARRRRAKAKKVAAAAKAGAAAGTTAGLSEREQLHRQQSANGSTTQVTPPSIFPYNDTFLNY